MTKPVGAAWALVALLTVTSCRSTATAPAEAAAEVKVATAERRAVAEWLTLFGRVVPPADRDATLAPQVPGVLLTVAVREGDLVRTGELVARVDRAPLEDALAAAEAAERRAVSEAAYRRRVAERTRALFDKGVASRQEAEADEAAAASGEAALTEANSGLATARRRREWSDLHAPFDGVVMRVMRRAGDAVDGSPATPVLEIAALWPAQVAADAPADALAHLAPGQRAEVAGSLGHEAQKARVVRVARSVDAATGVGEVRVALDEPGTAVVLGASVSLRIAVREKANVLTVPAACLRHGAEGAYEVVIVREGKAVVRAVVRGLADGDRVEIASGLEPGDQVVVDDPMALTDGTAVSVHP